MATKFDTAVVTAAGKELLQKVQQGLTTMQFTGFGLGSGEWDEADIATATALKSVKNTYSISSATTDDNGNMTLKVLMVNAESGSSVVATEYEMTELGLYAKDGANNTVLYGLGIPSGTPDVMPVFDGSNLVQIEQTWTIPIGAATVTVDYSGAVALAADLQTAVTALNTHKAESVASQAGAHGVRYYDEKLEVKVDDTWEEAASSGGSMVTVTTEEALLLNKTCTLVIGGTTYTETISAQGTCVFDGIKETGTATITANNGASDVTETLSVPYYGEYTVELIDGVAMVINISTSETTLYGQTATITYGGNSKNVLLGADGSATTKVKYGSDGTMTVTATDGDQTATTEVSIASGTTTYDVSLSFVMIYGVEWDGSSTTTWSRTDDSALFTDPVPAVNNGNGSSPFDACYPWKDIKRVTDANAGTLVEIPKFYYKWTRTGNKMKLQIADGPKEGFLVSPAHADRGDGSGERDKVYVGAYHCATSTYKSTTGVKPVVSITRSAARSSIHNLGSDIWQWDYAMLWTIQMLYLVEFADWNSQAKIGGGCSATTSTSSAVYNMGSTDGMTYHTGTVSNSHSAYGACRYRYIENLWGNCYDWCDGIYFSGANVYCIKNPANFSDTTGGTKVGERPTSSNYISKYTNPSASGFEYALYPSETSGSDSTYVCDYCYYYASGVVLYVGGSYDQNQYHGLFYLDGSGDAPYSSASIGSRLQKLPSTA